MHCTIPLLDADDSLESVGACGKLSATPCSCLPLKSLCIIIVLLFVVTFHTCLHLPIQSCD